ncbi:MAG: polysaccharide deacetylase family protein [Deltaproteobacteria bacterium]|nr:polysaccharide deacetylase family protein [Deltaproteobacteria bacterium]
MNTFIYHRFDEQRYPSTNISSAVFTEQLEYLRTNKIEVLSLPRVAELLATGQALPDQAAALCVDDSYRSFYDVAMPLLREYDYPVTLFVNTDAVGTAGYLTWDELKELQAEGVEIGNHTASHTYLVEAEPGETSSQWRERIRQDILKAQDAFERHLGNRPTLFAYTFGEYSQQVVELIKELGFTAAFAQQSGVIHEDHDRYILPRFPMGGPFATLQGFVSKLKMKPLLVLQQEPFESVLVTNPPELSIKLVGESLRPERFNCFVQGDNRCWVEANQERGAGWYKILAEKPLTGRRNKYTLTLQTREGDWLWYSHPWVKADNPVPGSD